jgi:hypothetical protein
MTAKTPMVLAAARYTILGHRRFPLQIHDRLHDVSRSNSVLAVRMQHTFGIHFLAAVRLIDHLTRCTVKPGMFADQYLIFLLRHKLGR